MVKTSDEFVKEQMEEHEKMKRDIYLNGGYVDCVNPGCIDQGTAETSYLCKSCFHEQTLARKQQQLGAFPKTSEVVICGLYPCEHVIPGPLRTHAKPDSAALGVQLCMYKGKPPGLKWQSLINL